jgi:RimJ/RimL family protein N-acetyltransferase
MIVEKVDPISWKAVGAFAHETVFNEKSHPDWDRIDFALLSSKEGNPIGYVTCREVDHETLYWSYGGAMPYIRGTSTSWEGYKKMVDACRSDYKRIFTLIENDNIPMLKFAMKVGFRVIGTKTFKGKVLLEHLIEF